MARGMGTRPTAAVGLVALLLAPLAVLAFSTATAPPVAAQGCAPSLAVSKTVGLASGGETVTVSGSCYDVNKGVYVAFCVVPPPGSVPSPCGGGIDMAGTAGLSHWISSNPPPQGAGLTRPYGPGGSFTVSMTPSAQLNGSVDCRRVSCAIVTRNDHTRGSDRSQDVIVPIGFVDPAPVTTAPPVVTAPPTTAPPVETTTTTEAEATTTTTEAEDTTTSTTARALAADDDDEGAEAEELAADPASSEGGGSSGGIVLAVVLVLVVLAAGAVGGWWFLRRRNVPGSPS